MPNAIPSWLPPLAVLLAVIVVAFVAYQASLLVETSWKYRHESARPLVTLIVMTIVGLAIVALKVAGYV